MYDTDWWQKAVFYQIYPRSFADGDGDGVGDLRGITSRLDHLAWLGVDAVWISPIFRSPMFDFGYDVADYRDVDPLFGSLSDLDELIAAAHARDIRILLDLVPNHSSSEHPWFIESRSSRENPKRAWYWWRDGRDGGPPNNWESHFRGPAWTFDDNTGQWYLHLFLPEQPDLNWANPEVAEAFDDILRYWFDRGVDGFRIDVCHAMAKDAQLRDNPVDPEWKPGSGRPRLLRVHSQNQPEVHDIIRRWRRIFDEYDAVSVGEVYIRDTAEMAKYFGNGRDELHLAFNFSFLWAPWDASRFAAEVQQSEEFIPDGAWPTYTLSNHDHSRHASRYGPRRARAAALMLLTLRGTPFIYYGEEIGMEDVVDASGHDPFGRDPERTPMRWDASAAGGFSTGPPWLPLGPSEPNVETQRGDADSLLHLYRDLISLRRTTPALLDGGYERLLAPPGVLAYRRGADVDVAINMGGGPVDVTVGGTILIGTDRRRDGEAVAGVVRLLPDEGVLVRRDGSPG